MLVNSELEVGRLMLQFKSWRDYDKFQRETHRAYRFIRSPDQEEFLRTVLATSKSRTSVLKVGSILWRAQQGHDWRAEHPQEDLEVIVPAPHPPSRMKPRPDRANEGRANPKGIPYLYLATTKETAMSETRPWISSPISVASFKLKKKATVIDCSRYHDKFTFYFREPGPVKRERAVWTDIDRAFARPVERSDDVADYVPTQVMAELFKREGFDGVAYKSAFGENGFNVVFFDLDAAELTSCQLFSVKGIDFKFEPSDNPYFVKPPGKKK